MWEVEPIGSIIDNTASYCLVFLILHVLVNVPARVFYGNYWARGSSRRSCSTGALVNVLVRVFYGNYWARGSSRSSSTSLVTSPRAPRERVGSGDETNVARGAAECHMSFENSSRAQ